MVEGSLEVVVDTVIVVVAIAFEVVMGRVVASALP